MKKVIKATTATGELFEDDEILDGPPEDFDIYDHPIYGVIMKHLDSMFDELGVDEDLFPQYDQVVDLIYEFVSFYENRK